MKNFFYTNWVLYYLLLFLLLGLLIYALLWKPSYNQYNTVINTLKNELADCKNEKKRVDTVTQIYTPSDTISVDTIVNCNATVNSGGQGTTKTQHELQS